jgi:hypothetical protein
VDIQDLKRLAGIQNNPAEPSVGENISHTGTEKAEYQRKHNIKPGTDEWFRLWFARPYMTGENPMPKNKK